MNRHPLKVERLPRNAEKSLLLHRLVPNRKPIYSWVPGLAWTVPLAQVAATIGLVVPSFDQVVTLLPATALAAALHAVGDWAIRRAGTVQATLAPAWERPTSGGLARALWHMS